MEDRRWSLGIHEAVEVKENVELGGGTKTKTSITILPMLISNKKNIVRPEIISKVLSIPTKRIEYV
jgi:hypothetical protein